MEANVPPYGSENVPLTTKEPYGGYTIAMLFNVTDVFGDVVTNDPPTYLYVPFADTAFTCPDVPS